MRHDRRAGAVARPYDGITQETTPLACSAGEGPCSAENESMASQMWSVEVGPEPFRARS
jgi:hypothetical protein